MSRPRLLVHICCGPCAAWTITSLLEQGFEVTGFFYNPNIHPWQELRLRQEAAATAAEKLGIKMIRKEEHPSQWFRAVSFRENNRCFHCAHMRLEKTYFAARHGHFDCFTSTLLYSKHQRHDSIAASGRDLAVAGGPDFLYQDFRQGWNEGINLSNSWGLYRQTWCGCLYSNFERFAPKTI